MHPSISTHSLRSISFLFSLNLKVQPKHHCVIHQRIFTSKNIEFSVLPYFASTMERVSECGIQDIEENSETIPARKQKRHLESDSVSSTSPPSKKSYQSPYQQSEKIETYSASSSGNLQENRSVSDDQEPYRTSLPGHSEGKDESSESSIRLEDNTSESNQCIPEVETIDKQKIDSCTSVHSSGVSYPNVDDSVYQEKVHEDLLEGSSSVLSHSKHVLGDSLDDVSVTESLDQDVSITESINQDDSLVESGVFQDGIYETECDSLNSSQFLPDDNLSKHEENRSHADLDKVNDKAKEVVSSSGKDKKKHTKKQSKKRKKDKKHTKNEDVGDTINKNLRPNYFVGIQISNADIHKLIVKIQEDLIASDEFLAKSFVDVATSHITLLVAHIDTEDSLAIACAALDECSNRMIEDFKASPLLLTFSGVNHFSHQVLYACLVEDEHYLRLMSLAETVRQVFLEKGVCMPDTKVLHPHLTIAKISKAPRIKSKRTPRKIDPSCYKHHLQVHFGCQTVCALQLLAMNKTKDKKRYYYSSKEILFDVDVKENTDHSQCCFPRRPLLLKQLSKHQRSFSTSSAQPESSQGWLLPTVGVMTALAAAVVLGFIVAKYRKV